VPLVKSFVASAPHTQNSIRNLPKPSPPPFITYQYRNQIASQMPQGKSSSTGPYQHNLIPRLLILMTPIGPLPLAKLQDLPAILTLFTIFFSYHKLSPSYFSIISSVSFITIRKNVNRST